MGEQPMREPTEQEWDRRIRKHVEQTRDAPSFSVSDDARLLRNPFHPGEHIRDRFAPGMTVGEAAAALGVSRGRLSRIVNGHCGVSAEFALKLEKQGWGTADFWVGLQSNYDLAQIRKRRKQPRPKAA